MNREEYRSILGRLPIKNPTPEDMARMCPHLTQDQAVRALVTGSGLVACPSLFVRNAFQVVLYQPEWVEEHRVQGEINGERTRVINATKNHPPYLRWGFTGRASYAGGSDHAAEAIAFAEANWGAELVQDTWVDVVEFYVQDPTDLVNDQHHTDYPRTKAVIYVGVNRPWNDIINDRTKSRSGVIDDAIVQMTLHRMAWHEMKGGRGSYTQFNCAHCGAGLLLSACSGCGHQFRDDHFRCGWYTPLSPKMVAFLRENGHQFAIDPQIAWTNEKEKLEAAKK